jgi:hypothetical protein
MTEHDDREIRRGHGSDRYMQEPGEPDAAAAHHRHRLDRFRFALRHRRRD